VVTSDIAQKAFEAKVEVLDALIQEVQGLADLFVRFLEIEPGEGVKAERGALVELLEAYAKTHIRYRHAITTISASIAARGGLEVRADWDF